ncbi:autotransporter outer membrane beta-barrel domain-containing protein [Morganella morganii]|uniref:autotransporter outer membrane beta-barrel domain-containing protein n=1 Tax=Morganella morganii TaxID=582 RepID=UPI0031AD3AC0
MTFNNSVLIALFSASFSAYATEPPPPYQSEVEVPDINTILSSATDGWPTAKDKWDNKYQSIITGNQYINGQTLTRTWFPEQFLYVENNSYSLNNTIDSFQTTFRSGSVAIGNIVKGGITNPSDPSKVYRGFMSMMEDSVAYNTIVEDNGSLSLGNDAKAYNTTVNAGGRMVVGTRGYAQAILIDGGYLEQSVTSTSNTKDVIVVNGGQHIIYGGTATNSHIGSGSYQMSSGNTIDTVLYDGAVQQIYAGKDGVTDRNTIVNHGALQFVTHGNTEDTRVYGTQIITGVDGEWENGEWTSDGSFRIDDQTAKNATIYAGGVQRIQTGEAIDTRVYGQQIVSGKKGGWTGGQWVEQDAWIGKDQVATGSVIHQGGEQIVEYYADAVGTLVNGGTQLVKEFGHIQDTTVENGGSSFIAYGAYSTGDLNVNDGSVTMEGGSLHSWTGALDGKGAYVTRLNLAGDNAFMYLKHNDTTSESEATIETLANNGTVVFGSSDGTDAGKYSRLQISDLTGSGTFVMNTNINGGTGDFLNISNSISGEFNVRVMDSGQELKSRGGVNPHHLIFANGSDSNSFALVNGSVDLGAYKYYLVQGDEQDSDNWYLSPKANEPAPNPDPEPGPDPDPKPEISESGKNAIAMANVTPTIWNSELSTLRTRLGDLRDNQTAQDGVWGKYIGSRNRISTSNVGYTQDMNGLMLGGDHAIALENGRLLVGGMFSYTHSELDARTSDGKVDSLGLGVYTTWMHNSGYYVDGVLKANHFRTKNSAQFNDGKTTAKDNTNGIGFSVEGGKHITAGSYFIEPYVLGSYFRGEKTAYRFSSDMKVKADAAESVKGEIGTTFGKTFVTESGGLIKPYARLAVSHEFKKNNDVVINDTESFSNDMSGTVGKYGVGLTAQMNNQWSAYAEFNYAKGSHVETPYSGNLGIRYSF